MQNFTNRIVVILVSATCLNYICAITFLFLYAGISPWHDELWNLYASTKFIGWNGVWPGCAQKMCITFAGYEVPILSGPYHGVIKTLIFTPTLLFEDINIIRSLNIFLYFAPLFYIIFKKKKFGKINTLILIFGYYLIFPNLIFEGYFDQGQFLISNALYLISIILFIENFFNYSVNKNIAIIILCVLAVYEKLTNLPMSLCLGGFAFIYLIYKGFYMKAVFSCISLLILTPYLYYFSSFYSNFRNMTSAVKLDYFSNLYVFIRSAYESLLKHSFTLSNISDSDIVSFSSFSALLLIVILFLSAVLMIYRDNKHRIISLAVFISLPICVILTIPFFDGLNRPWHTYQIAPLILLPIGGIVICGESAYIKYKIYFLYALIIIGNLNLFTFNVANLSAKKSYPYDRTLITISEVIKRHGKASKIVCVDYSVCYNLVLMLGPRYSILSEYSFSPVEDICRYLGALEKTPHYLITKRSFNDHDQDWQKKVDSFQSEEKRQDFIFLNERSHSVKNNCISGYLDRTKELGVNLSPGYDIYTNF